MMQASIGLADQQLPRHASYVVKLLVGLLKGAAIGGAVGYGAVALADATGFGNAWLTYGLIGALVGLFVGRPLWALLKDKNTTNIIAIIKAAFGFGVGCGIYALLAKAWGPDPDLLVVADKPLLYWPPTLGAAIGGLYGAFVEIDDSIGDDGAKKKAPERKQLEK
jgi:hypothetical protein